MSLQATVKYTTPVYTAMEMNSLWLTAILPHTQCTLVWITGTTSTEQVLHVRLTAHQVKHKIRALVHCHGLSIVYTLHLYYYSETMLN